MPRSSKSLHEIVTSHWVLGGILLVLTGIAYSPAFQAGFIIDDADFFLEDPVVKAADGLFQVWLNPLNDNGVWPYLPITRTTFWLEYQLFGGNLTIAHTINIILHGLAALLLWRILLQFRIRGAWWVGMLFALHPIYVQSVAWIAQRKNGVAAIFFLLCVWSFWKFALKPRWHWYAITCLFLVCALLSKTSTIMLPPMLVLVCWWLRLPWKRRDTLLLIPLFGIAAVAGIARIWFETHAINPLEGFVQLSFLERLQVFGHVPFFYLKKLILPYPLMFNYPRWTLDVETLSLYLPLFSIVFIFGCLLWKYQTWGKPLFLALSAFGLGLFPVSGLFHNGWFSASYVADHWGHLPSIPLLILAVVGGVWTVSSNPNFSRFGGFAGGGFLILLVWLTWNQTRIYQNLDTLWTHTLQYNPKSWMGHHQLAVMHHRRNEWDSALAHYNQSIALEARFRLNHKNRGKLHDQLGQLPQAITDYSTALQLNASDIETYAQRGFAYYRTEAYAEAITDFNEVLRYIPNHPEALLYRGESYFLLQDYETAFQDYERLLQIYPQQAELYYQRGRKYLFLQQYASAINDFTRSLQLGTAQTPAAVYQSRGQAYFQASRPDLACGDWQQACQLGLCEPYQAAKAQGACP